MWLQYLIREGLWGGETELEALEEEDDEEIEEEAEGGGEAWWMRQVNISSPKRLWKQDGDMRRAGAASALGYR